MRARTDLWEPGASNRPGHLAFDHFRPSRVSEIYPAAQRIVDNIYDVRAKNPFGHMGQPCNQVNRMKGC